MKLSILTALLFLCTASSAQPATKIRLTVGIEQDALPYLTGGYFAGAWVGKNHWRGRVLTARVTRPAFILQKGFTNNTVQAYALLADYFLKENWKGWWAGSGLVVWKSSIQTKQKDNTAHYQNWLLNGSLGYNIPLGQKFYTAPWCGMHVRIAGDRTVAVGSQVFTPPLLNPEGSLKIGFHF